MLRACVLAFALLVTLPAVAGAASTAEQIAALNAQRAASGIPAGIVEQPAWTQACRNHLAYIAANGGTLTHEEVPGNPGYTPDGAEIGRTGVLTPLDDAFSAAGNAFEFAPLHLMQTLAPALSRMGVFGGCATTIVGYDRKATSPALYTYPGNGATNVYASEEAYELPFVPGDFVGLPQGTTTGPHIYVMTLGTGPGHITSAALTGPAGPVEIRAVDNLTKGLEGYMPPGGIIIPVSPLAAGATYSVAATFQPNDGAALSRTWSFATGDPAATDGSLPSPPAAALRTTLRLGNPRPAHRAVAFTLLADPALIGRRASVIVYRVVRRCAPACRDRQIGHRLQSSIGRLAARQTIAAPRPVKGRAIVVQVQTPAFTRGGVAYAAGTAVARWAAP
jgi:hypothetical protein